MISSYLSIGGQSYLVSGLVGGGRYLVELVRCASWPGNHGDQKEKMMTIFVKIFREKVRNPRDSTSCDGYFSTLL